ncbi:MAG: lysophospholipid acyltransferase family protein [Anaerolineales bacterium]
MSFWLRVKRRFFRVLTSGLVHLAASIEVHGLERIHQSKGTAIVVCNHLGRLDAALTLALVNRDDLIVVIAEKYRQYGVVRWVAKTLDLLFLDRFESDFSTVREVLRRLERGGLLVISPEGTRSPTEALLEGKPGAAFLAAKTGATLIPVGVTGTEDRIVLERYRKFRRPHLRIVVGEPFKISSIPRKGRNEFFRQSTEEIMVRIAALLPQQYRGVYESHPRVDELVI